MINKAKIAYAENPIRIIGPILFLLMVPNQSFREMLTESCGPNATLYFLIGIPIMLLDAIYGADFRSKKKQRITKRKTSLI